MGSFKLSAEVRTETGKEKIKKIRREGRFPAIIYGAGGEAVSLVLDTREMELVLARTHGEKVLVDLSYAGKEEKVFVRNVQRDPVKELLLHADFFRVDLNKEMDTKVPVISVGLPVGVKLGGLLEHGVRELAIRCLPGDVPPHIEVNVEELNIGDSIHVRDMDEIKGVRVLSPEDSVLFAVAAKAKEPEPTTDVTEEGEEAESEETEPAHTAG